MKKINLTSVRALMDKHDKTREKVISRARVIIRNSKTAIGHVHRDELEGAEKMLETMKGALADLKKVAKGNPKLIHEGIFKVAVQEYVEALSLYEYVKSGNIPSYSDEFVDPEHYLLGLCDLCGELVRKAIHSAITDNYLLAVKIRRTLEDLFTELSKFDFKNGEVRRKYDGIKYDLKKLDDVVFQLKMKDKI